MVQQQQREVREVVAGETLVLQMGLDAAEAPQSTPPRAQAPPVRELDAAVIPHHHVLDVAPPVHQHAHLSADLRADLGEGPGHLVGDEPVRRDSSPEEALERARRISQIADEVSMGLIDGHIGKSLEVLVEDPPDAGPGSGRWCGQAPEVDGVVLFHGDAVVGEIVPVRITDSEGFDLVGRVEP